MESNPGGTSAPSALAVCRLMANSNLVDWRVGGLMKACLLPALLHRDSRRRIRGAGYRPPNARNPPDEYPAGSIGCLHYCDAVKRGGVRCNIHSSIAAITATINPTITSVRIALVLPENLSAQGETRIHRPTIRLSLGFCLGLPELRARASTRFGSSALCRQKFSARGLVSHYAG